MKKILCVILMSILIFTQSIYAEGYMEGYSDWSLEKTGKPGEVEKTQYGYMEGTYPSLPINDIQVYTSKDDLDFYKNIYKYDYVYATYNEITDFNINDTKAKAGVVWSKYLDGCHLVKLVSDIDMANSSTWTNYHQPQIDVYDDSGFLFIAQRYSDNVQENGTWNGDIVIKGNLYMIAHDDSGQGRNWTGAGGADYISYYKEQTKTSKWVYSTKDIKDLLRVVKINKEGYVVPMFSEAKGWRFDKPYTNRNTNSPIKAVERKVYSYPLSFKINYHLDGGEFKKDYPTEYYPGTETVLVDPAKKGYEFIGWYLDERFIDGPIKNISKSTKGDIDLYAKYKRKAPVIKVRRSYLYKNEDDILPIDSLLQMATANDELDGDISNKVFVEKIKYTNIDLVEIMPKSISASTSDKLIVTFAVYNSGNIKASVDVQIYILTSGKEINKRIYPRYIDKNYIDTLKENSRWNDSDYYSILIDYVNKERE